MFPLVLLAACQQAVVTPTAPIAPQTAQAWTVSPAVSQPMRLAITPKLDGKIDPEEWDPFAVGSVESFLQWEPGRVHVAARAAAGQDVVVTLDLKGDGWLQGADNVEYRIKWNGTSAEVTSRRLDATRTEGPAWVESGGLAAAAKVAAAMEGDKWVAELSVGDAGFQLIPEKQGATIGARVDAAAPTEALAEPYLPRAVGLVTLSLDRGDNLPTGFKWAPEYRGRSVVPGEGFRIRLTFNGSDLLDFKRIDMRTEGLGANQTSSSGVPFPKFDRKNRAFVDYEVAPVAEASPGWRVLRGTIVDGAGNSTVLRTSYEIAPTVQFDFDYPGKLASSSEPQKVRLSTFIRSNTRKRVNGVFHVAVPNGFSVDAGNDKPFVIYGSRGSKRQVFEITIPGGFKGTLPVTLIAEVGVERYEQTVFLDVP